jgi:hypothetical protein
MQRVIAQNTLPGAIGRQATTLPPSLDVSFRGRPVICPEIEFAVLKATLLTFDHLLRSHTDRFTRSPTLQTVRGFVRRCVMDGDKPDALQLGQLVLGLQYDVDYLELYQKLRDDLRFPASPFEHVLLASANAPTQTLDVVFWAFRADPYAFRVCNDWQSDSFTFCVVNGVLAQTSFSDAIRLDGGHLLGRATQWRSYRHITPFSPPDHGQRIRDELFARRSRLYRQSVDHIERHFDDNVIDRLHDFASLNVNGDHRVKTQVVDRLRIAFNSRIQSKDARAQFARLVEEILEGAPDDVCRLENEGRIQSAVNWPLWLERYRKCLDALLEPFGLPGDVYQTGGGESVGGPLGKR